MAVTGVSNLTELISDQQAGQSRNIVAGAKPTQAPGAGTVALTQDSFTPSAQNGLVQPTAQDPALFQVSQIAISSATAGILSAQTAPPELAQNPVPTQAALTAAPAAAAAPKPAPPPATAATSNSQIQVQSLNEVLLGLGLSNREIQDIDRLATLTKDFNPTLYTDLVQQFEAQAAQQGAVAAGSSQQRRPSQQQPKSDRRKEKTEWTEFAPIPAMMAIAEVRLRLLQSKWSIVLALI